jgi:hypothetical protein
MKKWMLAGMLLLTGCRSTSPQVDAISAFFSAVNSGELAKARTLVTGNISDSMLGSDLSPEKVVMWKSIWSHVKVSNLKVDSDINDPETVQVKGDVQSVDFEEMHRARRFPSAYPTAEEVTTALQQPDLPMKSFPYDFTALKDPDAWRIGPITSFENVIVH